MVKCDYCGKEVKEEKIYAFYPEDSTYLCKDCFKKMKDCNEEQKEKVKS